jgi:hypothetical protein
MDAVVSRPHSIQWTDDMIQRDVLKAVCAFSRSPTNEDTPLPTVPASTLWSSYPEANGVIATGNWGCGGMGPSDNY